MSGSLLGAEAGLQGSKKQLLKHYVVNETISKELSEAMHVFFSFLRLKIFPS